MKDEVGVCLAVDVHRMEVISLHDVGPDKHPQGVIGGKTLEKSMARIIAHHRVVIKVLGQWEFVDLDSTLESSDNPIFVLEIFLGFLPSVQIKCLEPLGKSIKLRLVLKLIWINLIKIKLHLWPTIKILFSFNGAFGNLFIVYLHKCHFRFYLLFFKFRTEPVPPCLGNLCH